VRHISGTQKSLLLAIGVRTCRPQAEDRRLDRLGSDGLVVSRRRPRITVAEDFGGHLLVDSALGQKCPDRATKVLERPAWNTCRRHGRVKLRGDAVVDASGMRAILVEDAGVAYSADLPAAQPLDGLGGERDEAVAARLTAPVRPAADPPAAFPDGQTDFP